MIEAAKETQSGQFMHELFWDSTYAIALALLKHYPDVRPQDIGLAELAKMVENLPDFQDDPALVTERILLDIQITWYEEFTTLGGILHDNRRHHV